MTSSNEASQATVGEIIEQGMSSEKNNGLALPPASNSEISINSEGTNNASDHPSNLPASQALVNPIEQQPPDTGAQTSINSAMDTTSEAPVLISTAATTEKPIQSQSISESHQPASIASMSDTSTPTVTTSLQTDVTTCINSSITDKPIQLSSSSCNVTATASTITASLVTHTGGVKNTFSTASSYSLPSAVKLEPSTLGKVKIEPHDFDNFQFPKPVLPITGASGYDSSKVAAEMAKIDLFLASLAKGGASSNIVPNMNFSKVKTDNVFKPAPLPVGSALGNIAASYGYSEGESSSSSSDESEDDHQPVAKRSTKMTAAAAVVAMDTEEVERSLKKVAVSSDSSSSSSEDELG